MELLRIEPQARKEYDGFYAIPIKIEAVGSYPALYSYLSEMKQGREVFRVDELVIQRLGQPATRSQRCQFRIGIELLSLDMEGEA